MMNKGKARQETPKALELLDLPGEILSQITGYLPLNEVIAFLSLNSALHNLSRSHLTPFRPLIHGLVRAGPPYPTALAVLPSLSHLVGHDDGNLFLEILVRAPPKWILERFEIGRWRDHVWQEAFERRFLASWKRYKSTDDSWRAAFLRVLGRLDHRSVGCAHHESWTRFITLRRNRSAAINRIYTRTFDPNEIFDELKHQSNLIDYPTEVRVLIHLQDVRVIALCVLSDKPTYTANSNAHLALHPPLLRHLSGGHQYRPAVQKRKGSLPATATSAWNQQPVGGESYFPLVRTTSSSASAPNNATETAATASSPVSTGPSSPGRISGFGQWMNRRRRLSADSNTGEGSSFNPLTLVRSREDDRERRRSWNFGRTRTLSAGGTSSHNAGPSTQPNTAMEPPAAAQLAPVFTSPIIQPTPLISLPEDKTLTSPLPTPQSSPSPPPLRRHRLPYPPLTHPTPADSHRLYPNFTPCEDKTLPSTSRPDPTDPTQLLTEGLVRRVRDYRPDHLEVEDDDESAGWSTNDAVWGGDGSRMAEWDPFTATRRRWVGPMIILAQIFSADRPEGVPAGVARDTIVEGPNPDLGPRGTYASLGWEDIDVLLPWLELSGSGAFHTARTSGMGFDPGQEL